MMKKKFKKIIGCFLAGTMLAATLTGCGNETTKESVTQVVSKETESTVVKESETQAVVEEGFTYPIDTEETLTVGIVQDAAISAICKDITETAFWKHYQERLGVKLEAIVVENNNAMSLLLAGGDLPDIIWWRPARYSGGAEQMIADELIAPLTAEELNEWAPDLAAFFESNPDVRKELTSNDGEIIGFPLIYGDEGEYEYMQTSNGLMARADWLKELNMDVPKTPDQFLDMLRAFKNEMGAEVPFVCYSSDMQVFGNLGFVSSAYGLVNTSLYQVDGKVECGYASPEYKEVLKFVKTMYDEGLIAKDFMTTDSTTMKANMYDDTSGSTFGSVGSNMGTWIKEKQAEEPEYDLVAIPSMTADGTGRAMYGAQSSRVHQFAAFITPQCDNKELAAKVLNYGYSEEGNMFFNFGTEGESYTMVDGKPIYTELVTNNPDGLNMQQALAQNGRAFGTGPYVVRKGYMEQYAALPQQQNAIETWMDNDCLKYMLPNFTVPEENLSEYSLLSSDISTYKSEMFNKFVTGEVSLDAYETEYLPTLKQMGLERYLEIVQDAVDAFYAK